MSASGQAFQWTETSLKQWGAGTQRVSILFAFRRIRDAILFFTYTTRSTGMSIPKAYVRLAVIGLLVVQATLILITLHRESLTFDEEDHMYAGYRMWTAGDYGLNPEHPPLVKLLATLPVLGEKLWVPAPKGIFFKAEAYTDGGEWLEHNDGASQRLVFRMRVTTSILALALSLLIFVAARQWFGVEAALFAMSFAVFEPNLLAHSGLVTTDVGAALFLLLAVYTFCRYVQTPSWWRVLIAGLAAGLLLATKHSGVLVGPILPLMAAWEVATAAKGTRARLALQLASACVLIAGISVLVLWSFYGFRYAARPAGLQLVPTLAQYSDSLKPFEKGVIGWIAHMHLLPESYLMGLVDIRNFAKTFNTYLLGRWYPHGVYWYFPIVITIKSTLGMLAALVLTCFALAKGWMHANLKGGTSPDRVRGRALAFLAIAGAVFLAVTIQNGLNIGVRHILPCYVIATILAGAGLAALAARSRRWMWVGVILVGAHIASSLSVFPYTIAYANEAWGGARNTHLYLSDSNVDWGQQIYQVKEWQNRHPGEECWFASFVEGVVPLDMYGVKCHMLPNSMAGVFGTAPADSVPPVIHGAVLLSASEVAGGTWPSKEMNPYQRFQTLKPDEEIDYGILVYKGDIPMAEAGGTCRALQAGNKLQQKQIPEALALAEDAVKMAPDSLFAQWVLGDAEAASGHKDEARAAYLRAIEITKQMEPERAAEFQGYIQASINKL
jgi:4-amino-4-deoxy-L-arabinose transferase-like glycosyltransferase